MKQNFTPGDPVPPSPTAKLPYNGFKKVVFYSAGYILIKWLIILIVGGTLYKTGHWKNWYLALVPVIGIAVLFIKRKIKANKNKKHVDY